MIDNQMHFSQPTQKLPLKLADKQVQQLPRHIIKQSFNLASQNCKLHPENRELIIMFYVKSLPFFHVSLALQMILIVFIQKTEQIQISFKVQIIIAVLFVIQNVAHFIA